MSTKGITTTKEINFYDAHTPSLLDGDYEVTITQNIEVENIVTANKKTTKTVLANEIVTKNQSFRVSGPRFSIEPSLIHSVYPPKGGKGDYRADLPKLVLNRSTLPWERIPTTTQQIGNTASWLYLLLVDESETDKITEHNGVTLQQKVGVAGGALIASDGTTTIGDVNEPIDVAAHQHKFNCLGVDPTFLFSVIPENINELEYLSYASIKEMSTTETDQTTNKSKTVNDFEEEKGVLIGNRLPKAGSNSTVYLVSLEALYSGTSDLDTSSYAGPALMTNLQAGDTHSMFLPYLYKWDFHALSEQLYCITEDDVDKINKVAPTLTLPDLKSLYGQLYLNTGEFKESMTTFFSKENAKAKAAESSTTYDITTALPVLKRFAALPGSTFHGLLSDLSGGFAPLTMAPTATDITAIGTVNLAYKTCIQNSNGSITKALNNNAYYRSPFVANKFPSFIAPADNGIADIPWKLPNHAKELIFSNTTFTDTTYAAAFELGRLTALDDVIFAKAFYQWKSETAKAIHMQNSGANQNIMHLPHYTAPTVQAMPKVVLDKIKQWKALEGIPYRYLVPDANMLPTESLRYFYVDPNWINAFLCGAFSLGHTVQADLRQQLNAILLPESMLQTGFLLNSFAVSGWPDYEVDIYKDLVPTPLPTTMPDTLSYTKRNLDIDISLFLLDDTFVELHFHLHQSKVHTGFMYENDVYYKAKSANDNVSVTVASNNRIENISTLAKTLTTNNGVATEDDQKVSAFAKAMLEGTPRVKFTIQ